MWGRTEIYRYGLTVPEIGQMLADGFGRHHTIREPFPWK